jgi:glutamate dehydrogenase/leucine dehydrogenase
MIPDFIANCGMARVFAYLMQTDAVLTDEAIFNDVSTVIRSAIDEIYQQNPDTKLLSTRALKIALNKLLD